MNFSLLARIAIVSLFFPQAARSQSEVQKMAWTGRVLVFDSKDNILQLPLTRPTVFTDPEDKIPAGNTFGRKARVAGVTKGGAHTYLVVDMMDSKERFYFYYGDRFDSGGIPEPPTGTHLEAVVATPGTPAPRKKAKPTSTTSAQPPKAPPQKSSGFGTLVIGSALLFGIYLGFIRRENEDQPKRDARDMPAESPPEAPRPPKLRAPNERILFSIRISTPSDGDIYSGPRPTSTNGDQFWKTPGTPIRIEGFSFDCMAYTGSGLASVDESGVEPALIDPKLSIASGVDDCSTRRLSYWPSYSGASLEARSAYLRWLATGCKDPQADIGYVFLYFYGLERRALHDSKSSARAKEGIPSIEREIQRLLGIYENRSFQSYAGTFLDVLQAAKTSEKLYLKPPPQLLGSRFLSFSHRLGLAQCAADEVPLPAEWAYAWLQGDPSTRLRTPAQRCPDEFKQLFGLRYTELFGTGIKLPRNKTQLRLDYRPASPSFRGAPFGTELKFELPDVSTLSSPIKKIQAVAESCSAEIESYSRAVGKGRERANSFEAMVELPGPFGLSGIAPRFKGRGGW